MCLHLWCSRLAQSFQHFKKLKIRNKLFNDFFKKMSSPPKSDDGCVGEVEGDSRTDDACKNVQCEKNACENAQCEKNACENTQCEKNACENAPCEKSMLRDRKPTPGIKL